MAAGCRMDFFYRNLEAAQEQARSLTISAGNSARGLAEQLSEQTKSLAEQAASVSSQAAEQASERWKGINLQDTLQLRGLQRDGSANAGPSNEELSQYAITPDFKEFVQSLTYSTFRDFPLDQLPDVPKDAQAQVLTPWQEKHALFIVQEVKEINELRFVLCPKRMNDAQFWIVYFSLARKYMPPEAFDPGFSVPEAGEKGEPQRKLLDLQEGIRKTFETAKQTASRWKDRATNTLQPAETSAQLHDLVESHSRGTTPRASASAVAGSKEGGVFGPAEGHGKNAAEPDLDKDLEAYLQTMAHEEKEGTSSRGEEQGKDSDESAADLDEYLNELKEESEKAESDSEDAVDVEKYLSSGETEEAA